MEAEMIRLEATTRAAEVVAGRNASLETFDPGDVAWTLTSTALVWLMIPGIGFFYSGMARSISALSLIVLCLWSIAVVSIQWFLFGYSLTFSEKGNFFVGNLDKMFLMNVGTPSISCNPRVPEILFCIYHGMIAGIVPALVIGATAERGRFLPTIVFMFLWTTFVYDFIAKWSWAADGWSGQNGLDFAGGTPVHISAGAAAVAYSMILGERHSRNVVKYKPHNLIQVILGTSFMWFGWFGFNGGSALGANARTAMVIVVTNLSACFGGITWALIDYYRNKTFSALSFCFGAVAGLVAVTPASGYIRPASAVVFGVFGSLACRMSVDLKDKLGIDDALDVLNIHGIGGFVGTIMTGVFAEASITSMDGMTRDRNLGGWVDGNWLLVLYQLADCVAGMTWSFCITYAILWVMNKVPGLKLRVDDNTARQGLDKAEMGENAYERINETSIQE